MLPIPDQDKILPLIQLSITPVILISGLGALALSMTNRMGRIVDRTRSLAALLRQEKGDEEHAHLEHQMRILFRRAKIMRLGMTLVTTSMFISGLLILLLFVSQVARVEMSGVVLGAFVASIVAMLAGLGAFIRDVFLSLHALQLEVGRALKSPPMP